MKREITLQTEPVAIVNAIAFAVKMTLYAVLAFGVSVTEVQLLAVVAAVESIGGVFVVLFTRARVASPQTVAALDDRIDHGGL